LCQAFLNRERILGLEYHHNDYVRVTDGPHQGKFGSLSSLLSAEIEPMFLMELEDGGDVEIAQSQLCFISHNSYSATSALGQNALSRTCVPCRPWQTALREATGATRFADEPIDSICNHSIG